VLDLAVARIDVAASLRQLEDVQVWTRAPYWYVERLGTAISSLLRGDGLAAEEQGAALLSRLAYLATAQANLSPASAPLHIEMGLTAIQGLRQFLASAIPGFARTLPTALQSDLDRAATAAQHVLDSFEHFLNGFHGQARGSFARSITLHEIYPGHHTQTVHHKLATTASPMRRYFSSPLFVEGWGLYTEDLMEETGFMAEPAVYLLGKTAIHDLRRRWQAQQGAGFTLKAFHDTLLSFGSPPVKLVADQMLTL
jgi:hypothetical protein